MELRQLLHFIAAVEHGNIVRAASAVHITQPALSKSIQKLEAWLGVPLLARTPRGVSPTPYGEILLRYARLMQTQGERAAAEIAAVKSGRRGHLTIGVGMSFIGFLLPGVVAELLDAHPGLSLAVVDGNYDTLVARLEHGELDAVLAAFPPVPRREGLVYEELLLSPLVFVTRADHPVVRRRNVALATLAPERWILLSRPAALRDTLNTAFDRAGVPPPAVPLLATSLHFLRNVIREGRFVSLLPRDIVEEDLAAGRLGEIDVAEKPRPARSGVIRRAEGVRPPALDLLVAALAHRRDALAAGATPAAPAKRRPR